MLVVVVFVQAVLVGVVDVVGMVAVLDRIVATAVAVLVVGNGVLGHAFMLVVVVVVDSVAVGVVKVVDVVAVLDRGMAAAVAVLVVGDGVLCVDVGAHGVSLHRGVRRGRRSL